MGKYLAVLFIYAFNFASDRTIIFSQLRNLYNTVTLQLNDNIADDGDRAEHLKLR